MTTSSPFPPGVCRPPAETWTERQGGWVLSFCFHAVLFCLLATHWTAPQAPRPLARSVRIELARRQPPAPPRTVFPAASEVLPVAPAREAGGETAEAPPAPANPALASLERTESAQARPGTPSPAIAAQDAKIREILRAHAEDANPLRESARDSRRKLKQRLEAARVVASAAQHFPSYEGAKVGAVRTLDFRGVDPDVADQVMRRYDIRVASRFVGKATAPNYLNSAATADSVYRANSEGGYAEVFEISPQAYRKMVWLENQWLVNHGYDPRVTRVDTVEFGIVQEEGSVWDLGIARMEIQKIEQEGISPTDE